MDHEWVFFLIILPLILLLLNFTYFFIILLHELFHAIPALIFTNENVAIYIGYDRQEIGKIGKSLNIRKLSFFIKPKFSYFKTGGYCLHTAKGVTINQDIIIILSGPIISALISMLLCLLAFYYDWHGFLKLLFVILSLLAFLSLVINLYPKATPDVVSRAALSKTDGYNLLRLLKFKFKFGRYLTAIDQWLKNENESISPQIATITIVDHSPIEVFRLMTNLLISCKLFEHADQLSNMFKHEYVDDWNSDDYCNVGFIKSKLDFVDDALIYYNKSLKINPENRFSLNNRGYTYNLLKRYHDGIADFSKAIELDRNTAYPYCNRGLAKIKIGLLDDGLNDINQSIILDPCNSYSYLNLGIYNFDLEKFEEALMLFNKAKELDSTTHNVDQYIDEAKEKLNANA